MDKNIAPIIYTFSAKDIRQQRLDGFLALFTRSALASHESAHALLNSVQLNFNLGRRKDVTACDVPQVRTLCLRLFAECPVLPWIANLRTQSYGEVVYSILPNIQVTYDEPGSYEVVFKEADMEEALVRQVAAILRVGETAKIQPDVVRERIESLTRYLREGVNIL
jgi:hypothetical protein